MINWSGYGRRLPWFNFKVMSQYLTGGTEEYHEKPQSG
jgi:hypothetical protein